MKEKIGSFQLIYDPPIGGAEIAQHRLYSKISDKYDIQVHCFMENFMSFKRFISFEKDGVTIHRCNAALFKQNLERFIDVNRPKCIITYLIGSDVVADIAHKKRIPIIFFAHGIFEDICGMNPIKCQEDISKCDFNNCMNKNKIMIHRIKYSRCKYIVCNSEFTYEMFMRFFPEFEDKCIILYPDFNFDLFEYDGNIKNEMNIFAVNSHPLKGSDFIVSLAKKYPSINISYAGCDFKTGESFGCKNIKALGRITREEMKDCFQRSSVTIIPTSLNETFCGTAYESILCGTPVISTRKGNLPNIVQDGITGRIMDDLSIDSWMDKIKAYSMMRVQKDFVDDIRFRLKNKTDTTELIHLIEGI